MDDKFEMYALEWRGIYLLEDACPKCGGSGVIAYASTSTWMGGIGGQAITDGVCDECWGSGSKTRKWLDLRKFRSELARLRVERDELRAALEGVVAVRGYAESIERGEDWTGGEPTIGTCRLLGRIKQAANSASAVLSRTEGGEVEG